MKIVLGSFTSSFYNLAIIYNCDTFTWSWIDYYENYKEEFNKILNFHHPLIKTDYLVVASAIEVAEEIYFDLSHIEIRVPYTGEYKPVTLNELHYVMDHAIDKTRFFRNGIEVDKHDVINEYNYVFKYHHVRDLLFSQIKEVKVLSKN